MSATHPTADNKPTENKPAEQPAANNQQKPWKLIKPAKRDEGPREIWRATVKRGSEEQEITGTFDDVQKKVKRMTKE